MDGMVLRVNLNDKCRVVLRQRGVDALRAWYEQIGMEPPKVADGETYTTELWRVMEIFGPACSHGTDPPFDTEIGIRRRYK